MSRSNGTNSAIRVPLSKGVEIEVHRANVLMSSVLGRTARENTGKLSELVKKYPDYEKEDIFIQAVMIYPALYACSFPKDKVPTVEKFLEMDDIIGSLWMGAAEEQNPHWFEFGEKNQEPETDADKSKKGVKP